MAGGVLTDTGMWSTKN